MVLLARTECVLDVQYWSYVVKLSISSESRAKQKAVERERERLAIFSNSSSVALGRFQSPGMGLTLQQQGHHMELFYSRDGLIQLSLTRLRFGLARRRSNYD